MKPIVIDLQQGTDKWLEFRRKRLGASASPVIMKQQLDWNTPLSLWTELIKPIAETPKKQESNFAIDRGNRWEPAARARYEFFADGDYPPVVLVHPEFDWLMASLDGWNVEKKKVLEIKIPGREVFDMAKAKKVHPKYVHQLEHQMIVSGAESVDFFCCKVERVNGKEQITDDALVEYKSNPKVREELLNELKKFWFENVIKRIPPPLTDQDSAEIDGSEHSELFEELQAALLNLKGLENQWDEFESRVKAIKEKIADKLSHVKVRYKNIEITKRTRKGNVDIEKLAKDTGVDVDSYRGKESTWIDVKLIS